jgi:four helix bundle protein
MLTAGLMSDAFATCANGHDIRERAFEFACGVVEFCKRLYDEGGVARMMTAQLINSSTSVPANLEEARGAESRPDFISKCSISLKEARESHVRLRVCHRCLPGLKKEAAPLIDEAGQIASIVGAIVRNARRNAGLTLRGGRAIGAHARRRRGL